MSKVMSHGSEIPLVAISHLADVGSATTLEYQSVVPQQIARAWISRLLPTLAVLLF